MTNASVSLVVAALLAGCATGHTAIAERVPEGEAGAFYACQDFIATRACGNAGTTSLEQAVLKDVCVNRLGSQYASLSTPAERRDFLVQAGCPAALTR